MTIKVSSESFLCFHCPFDLNLHMYKKGIKTCTSSWRECCDCAIIFDSWLVLELGWTRVKARINHIAISMKIYHGVMNQAVERCLCNTSLSSLFPAANFLNAPKTQDPACLSKGRSNPLVISSQCR